MVGSNMFLKKFVARVVDDFRCRELLPLKLLFFVHASTVLVLYPYLTIQARELGISVRETAIMSAVTPAVAIIMPPLAGMVADRIGNFKILLATFSMVGGCVSLMLLLVPVGRITVTYPDRVVLDVGCSGGPWQLGLEDPGTCQIVDSLIGPSGSQVDTRLESCGFVCDPTDHQDPEVVQSLLMARSYDVVLSSDQTNTTHVFSYSIPSEDIPEKTSADDRKHSAKKKNKPFSTSIRTFRAGSFFFPSSELYNLTCHQPQGEYQCRFTADPGQQELVAFSSTLKMQIAASLQGGEANSSDRAQFSVMAVSQWRLPDQPPDLHNNTRLHNATCSTELSDSVLVAVPLLNPNNSLEVQRTVEMAGCRPLCLVTAPRSQVCSNNDDVVEFDVRLTFWSYLFIRVLIGVIGGTSFAMFEGAVIAILREHKADYGLQRIYGTIGGMISSPLSGLLIDFFSRGKSYTNFRPAFYLYAALKIVSGVIMLNINLEFKTPAKNVVKDVIHVLKNIEIVALFISLFIMGSAWGFLESFLFWLLQDLGASRSLMGITITVGGIAGIPLLVLSGPIIDRIGHANVLTIGFIFYGIRLIGYSLIYNPWLCLIFEAMESVTSSLCFTAAVTYAARLSTMSTDTSIQGLLGGLYFGVGKGAGSLIGGYMMAFFGTRQVYRIFAVVCFVVGIIYFLFNRFYLRKRPRRQGNDIVMKKSKQIQQNKLETDLKPVDEKVPNVFCKEDITNSCSPITTSDTNNELDVKKVKTINENKTEGDTKQDNKEENCNINLGYIENDEEGIFTQESNNDSKSLHTPIKVTEQVVDVEHDQVNKRTKDENNSNY